MKFIGGLIETGSGSIGGITASRNKGGSYLKTRAVPINPNTTRQQATRAALAAFASNWTALLSAAQRDQWNVYAATHTIKDALGQDIYINGIAWYIAHNSKLYDAGFSTILVPPATVTPIALSTASVDISAIATAYVTFTPALFANHAIQLWATLPGTPGQTPNLNQARLVGYSPVDQVSPWAAALPFNVQVGQQVTFYIGQMDDLGQVSVMIVARDIADYV